MGETARSWRRLEVIYPPDPPHFPIKEKPSHVFLGRRLTGVHKYVALWVDVISFWFKRKPTTLLGSALPPHLHLPHFTILSSDSIMHLPPLDKLAIRPRERLPSPAEGSVLESEEAKGQWRAGKLKSTIDIQRAEIFQLKSWKERYTRKYQTVKTQNAAMEDKIEDISKTHRDTLKQRDQRIRAVEDELARTKDELSRTKDELARTKDGLARTKELLAARSIELSGAQSFLSTKDRLSEAEVLGIVRDLNENIFQLAAKLTEEWEKYKSKAYGKIRIPKDSVKAFSQLYGAALIVHALDRDPTAVTFLLQSCLCLSVTQISSSWRRDSYEDMETLESIYQNLSASGRCIIVFGSPN